MLVKLSAEQVTEHWPAVKDMLRLALPEAKTMSRDNNVLQALLTGHYICWISYKKLEGKSNLIQGMAISKIEHDPVFEQKYIFLFAGAAWERTDAEFWLEAFDAIKRYGEAFGATGLKLFSKNPKIIKIAEKFNGNTDYRMITVPF